MPVGPFADFRRKSPQFCEEFGYRLQWDTQWDRSRASPVSQSDPALRVKWTLTTNVRVVRLQKSLKSRALALGHRAAQSQGGSAVRQAEILEARA
jgi:hypothetical protein